MFHTMMYGPQIHGAPVGLWGPAADAVGESSYRAGWGMILKTDSRHLSQGKWLLF